jgi:radical SAM protein with 4Fe4S-binding SPASM domain
LEELPAIVHFARAKGCLVSFLPVILASSSRTPDPFSAYAPEVAIKEEDFDLIDKIYDQLKEMKKASWPILNSFEFLDASRIYLKSGKLNWDCDAGGFYLSIGPEGKISICHHFDYPGKKISGALKELLESPQYQARRQELIAGCPGCIRPCWMETSLMMKDWRILLQLLKLNLKSFVSGKKFS